MKTSATKNAPRALSYPVNWKISYTASVVTRLATTYQTGAPRAMLERLERMFPLKGCSEGCPKELAAWLHRLLRGGTDRAKILGDVVREDPRARDQDVRPGRGDDWRGVHLDAAVDLQRAIEVLAVDVRPRLADLRNDVLPERLPREPRVDGHHE